jgi:hypothetical protein
LAVTFAAPGLPDPDDRGWEEEEAMMLDEKMTRRYLGRAGRRTDSPILASRATINGDMYRTHHEYYSIYHIIFPPKRERRKN